MHQSSQILKITRVWDHEHVLEAVSRVTCSILSLFDCLASCPSVHPCTKTAVVRNLSCLVACSRQIVCSHTRELFNILFSYNAPWRAIDSISEERPLIHLYYALTCDGFGCRAIFPYRRQMHIEGSSVREVARLSMWKDRAGSLPRFQRFRALGLALTGQNDVQELQTMWHTVNTLRFHNLVSRKSIFICFSISHSPCIFFCIPFCNFILICVLRYNCIWIFIYFSNSICICICIWIDICISFGIYTPICVCIRIYICI